MSAAIDLLQAATAAGAKFTVARDRVTVRAPLPLTPKLVEELRRSKVEILRLLTAKTGDGSTFPADTAWWRRHFTVRTVHWRLSGRRPNGEAERLAFGDLLDKWRKAHGRRWPIWQCAGCDEPIGGLSPLTLTDGNRVHFDEERECLVRFGRRWRSEAVAAMQAIGLEPPVSFELL